MDYRSSAIHQRQVFIKTMNAIAREDQKPSVYENVKDDLSRQETWWSNGIMELVFGGVALVTGFAFKAPLIKFFRKYFPGLFDCVSDIKDDGIIQFLMDYLKSFGQTQNTTGINTWNDPALNTKIKQLSKDVVEARRRLKIKNPKAPSKDIKCAEDVMTALHHGVAWGLAKKIAESKGVYGADQSVENLYQFLNNLGEGVAEGADFLIGLAGAAAKDGMYALSSDMILEHLKQVGINELANMSDTQMYTIGVALSALIAALAVVAGVPAAISGAIAALISALQSIGLAAGPAAGAILEVLRQMFPQYAPQLVIP